MQPPVPYKLKEQTLWLSAERCLYWEEEQALIVSDIHFGKTGHFRKAGIGIPQTVFKEDLQRLFAQIQLFKPNRLVVVGDFFHSSMNKEMQLFEKWRRDLSSLPIHLVLGNHDILNLSWYKEHEIEVHQPELCIAPFTFIHEPVTNAKPSASGYAFSGHLHPGVQVSGISKQSLRFPCFYFNETFAVLPAFGRFTGLHTVKPKKRDKVFAIVNKTILELQ
ncbi:MAG: ligase-associated DNA damage response endonuclease PdeM [Chitinophagaceae bacterium]|jgi:uncharacterized protein|nr:ligase-associated DNA damage response endonuclease PdeM [Chitinophagaceae bacterium]